MYFQIGVLMRLFRHNESKERHGEAKRRSLMRFGRDENGAAAIEFAILAIPFFLLVFAIIETCVAFAAEQTVNNVVNELGRELRTGRITFNTGAATDLTEKQFQARFCDKMSVMINCGTDVDKKLFLDLRSFDTFADIPTGVPRKNGAIDTTGFDFKPGGASTINVLRAYYLWRVTIDLMRPYISNITAAGDSMPHHYLIVGTTAYRNESYE